MGISFYAYVVHLWSEKRQKHLRSGDGRRRGLRRDRGTLRQSTLTRKRRVLPAPGSALVGPGLGASPPSWRVRAAGPGTRRHTRAPAAPRPRSACRAKPPPRRGDPASLPPRGGQLEERVVAGGSCGFHEPEESLCRLLRRAPPRTPSCPGSSHHLAACSGQRCRGRGGPRPTLPEPIPPRISPSFPRLTPSRRPEQRKSP